MKVNKGGTKSTSKTSGAKAKRAEQAAPKAKATQAKATQAKATQASAPVKRAEEFVGTQQGAVDRPAAQLPRSGWKDTAAFTDAARTARARNGGVGGIDSAPVIRPLYGLPMEIPLPKLSDKALREAAKNILNDRRITTTEVDALIQAAGDNGGLSKTEKKDLKRLMSEVGERFDAAALKKLDKFVNAQAPTRPDVRPDPTPVIRPLYGLAVPVPFDATLRDKKLDVAVKQMLGDRKMTLAEVETLIKNADDGRGLSKTERKDLERLLDEAGRFFDPAAKSRLEDYIGRMPPIRPLYGLPFAFPGPQVSMMGPMGMGPGVRPASSRPTVELAHAQAFVTTAKSNGGLDAMEKSEMRALLSGGAHFTAEAKAHIEAYLRTQ